MGVAPAAESGISAPRGQDLDVANELFIVPDDDRYLLYAPLTLGVARVNGATVQQLQQIRAGHSELSVFEPEVLAGLFEAGILVAREDADRRIAFPQKTAYDPSGITLFLTTKCTLACTYCYADGNDRPVMMPWDTAKSGLDWLFRHAEATKKDTVTVMFHGGGEVTVARQLLEDSVSYARAEGAKRSIRVLTGAGLNGVMKGPLLEWVIQNIDAATVSLDGLPEVHNAQRPLVNGKGSFDVVAAALRRMDEAGFNYTLRVTVTRLGLSKMVESVEFMCQNFGARVIHLEPVSAAGRARANDLTSPDPHEFVREFRKARKVARAYGRELGYSGARFGTLTNKFCQVSDDLLAITPDGLLSSCYEVGQPDDPRAETFFYGRLNPQTGDLDLDKKKIIRLRTLTVEHKSSCDECFCKWSCAGDCSAKQALAGNAWDATTSPRCIINRELTLDQMREYVESGVLPSLRPSPGQVY